jgi:hypothetical protein
MRRPRRLVRELTPLGALAFQLFLACNVFAALIHPIFMAGLCYSLLALPSLHAVGSMDAAAGIRCDVSRRIRLYDRD